tara:strand:- start:380 stop:520 length:141 start_codon:yes stop_codon:yes gene_type:complete
LPDKRNLNLPEFIMDLLKIPPKPIKNSTSRIGAINPGAEDAYRIST